MALASDSSEDVSALLQQNVDESEEADVSSAPFQEVIETQHSWGHRTGRDICISTEILRQGFNPLSLPGTIWSSLVLVYLQSGNGQILFPVFLQVVATVFLQGYAAYQIAVVASEVESTLCETCAEGNLLLARVCGCVFTILVLQDLKETFDMGRWLSRFPAATQWVPLRLREYSSTYTHISVGTVHVFALKPASGLMWRARFGLTIVALVPKAWIAFVILYYGTAYVMSAQSKEDLLQNSVSLVFVLEIDNAVYEMFIPNHLKLLVTRMQENPIALSGDEFTHGYAWKYNILGLVGVPCTTLALCLSVEHGVCAQVSSGLLNGLPTMFFAATLLSIALCSLSMQFFCLA